MNYMPSNAYTNILRIKDLVKSAFLPLGIVFTLTFSQLATAQTNSVSPLSIQGIGETTFGISPAYLGMGGTGIAYSDRFTINILNPAGYANMEYTTLEMSGAHRSFRHQIPSEGIDQTNFNTYFDYFGFGFKFADWIGGAFSLAPYAAKGYNVSVADTSDDFGLYEYRSLGSGGYDQFTLGLAMQPVPWFSIGGNAKYIFGEEVSSNKTIIADNRYLSVSKTTKHGISDFTFDAGMQLQGDIKNYHLVAGAVYGVGGEMNAREITTQYTFINSGIVETPIDTLYYNLASDGSMILPSFYGVGLGLSKKVEGIPVNAWDFVMDYRVTNWHEFRGFAPTGDVAPQTQFSLSERASAGLVFVPAYVLPQLNRTSNVFAIARYRFGASREIGQYHWDEQSYTTREVNFGISMPLIYRSLAPGEQKASFLNLSMGLGQRWDGVDSHLKEDYWNINLGITLNDKWFQKFRYR